MQIFQLLALLIAGGAQGLATTPLTDAKLSLREALAMPGRREVLASVAAVALGAVEKVDASGGATAGGAYLIRAKERYNARVVAGSKVWFTDLKAAVDDKDATKIAAIFAKDGAYDDLAAAGFLLANAFRINSTTPPDNIIQVKKFKKFKAAADTIPANAKKRKINTDDYTTATNLLTDFLNSVDLAP